MPTPEPYDLPEAVLDAAMSRLVVDDDRDRSAALAELIDAYPEHRDGLCALGAALDSAGRLLARSFASSAPDEPPRIEGYRVVRQLGEGAFGVVYLCEQHQPINRLVAIKLLRPGAGDRRTLARFDAERQFLARLNHPAIAQIFDAGLLADGRPWFVMEHVPGVPIAQYCDRAQLSVEARLSLFVRLCQGVQHAHEQGIVHRDLKPMNILVVDVDGQAQPKIIDFGIARALQPTTEHAEQRTETGRVVGTPGYMSPEQSAGRHDEIDARSDLFSLGVVLYELLTGELPWGKRPESTDSEPPRPSQRVASDQQRSTTIAEQRQSQPRKLASRLRGDLDWIVLEALQRERTRRYASAAELADEIQRHLRGEHVRAGPPSWGYRLRKFVRRRRAVLATAVGIVAMAAVSLWLLGQYRTEASMRGQEAESAVASLLARANDKGVIDRPDSTSVRKSLAQDALGFYDRFLQNRPDDPVSREGRARTLWTLSQVHWLLGQFVEAERAAREAVADSEALLAMATSSLNYRRILANAQRNLGRALFSLGRPAEARSQFQLAVDSLDRCHQQEPATAAGLLVRALMELVSTMDQDADAETRAAMLQRASDIQAELVREHPDAAEERDSLITIDLERSMCSARRGELGAARAVLARADDWIAAGIEFYPVTIAQVHTMAARLSAHDGDRATAIDRLQQGIAVLRAWMSKEPSKAEPFACLATMLEMLVDQQSADYPPNEAVATCRDALLLAETWMVRFPRARDARCSYILNAQRLALMLLMHGHRSGLEEAERVARRARELLAGLDGAPDHADRLRLSWITLGTLGLVADALGCADADGIWRDTAEAMNTWRELAVAGPQSTAEYVMYAARIARRHADAGRDAEARTMLAQAEAIIEAYAGVVPELLAHAPEVFRLLARLAAGEGHIEAAASLAERSLGSGGDWRALVAAAHAMTLVWRAARRIDAETALGHRDRAAELCQRTIETLSPMVAASPDNLWIVVPLAQTRIRLAQAQRDGGLVVDTATVGQALETLAGVRGDAHQNEWDEPLVLAGRSLLSQ